MAYKPQEKEVKVPVARVELKARGKLILSNKLQTQIDTLHSAVGAYEWCSVLLYKKEEGDISDPGSLVLRAEDMFLMDIGTAGGTEAKIDSEALLDLYDAFPGIYDMKQGLIHTHHSMATFFSGTDWSELEDNTPLHNYYLSLIVNFEGKYCAKVAYMAEIESKTKFRNTSDVCVEQTTAQKVMVVIDMDIQREEADLDEVFYTRYEKVRKAKEEKYKPRVTHYGHGSQYYYGDAWRSHEVEQSFTDTPPNEAARNGGVIANPIFPPEEESTNGGKIVVAGFNNQRYLDTNKSIQTSGQEVVGQNNGTFCRDRNHDPRIITHDQAKTIVLDWLNEGLRNEVNIYHREFVTINEGMTFFAGRFEAMDDMEILQRFLLHMQKSLVDVSQDFRPTVVAHKVGMLMKEFSWSAVYKHVAEPLSLLAEAHPQFVAEMKKLESNRPKYQNNIGWNL